LEENEGTSDPLEQERDGESKDAHHGDTKNGESAEDTEDLDASHANGDVKSEDEEGVLDDADTFAVEDADASVVVAAVTHAEAALLIQRLKFISQENGVVFCTSNVAMLFM